MPRATVVRNVTVKVGTTFSDSKEYSVPARTTVEELLGKVGISLESGQSVVDAHTNTISLTEQVKAGQEYIIAGNLKAF